MVVNIHITYIEIEEQEQKKNFLRRGGGGGGRVKITSGGVLAG